MTINVAIHRFYISTTLVFFLNGGWAGERETERGITMWRIKSSSTSSGSQPNELLILNLMMMNKNVYYDYG